MHATAPLQRSPSVEDLNGLGNSLYCSGNKSEAIETFDSALRMVQRQGMHSVASQFNFGGMRPIKRGLGKEVRAQYDLQFELPPDSYFEGECDVGPRPIHSPLHLTYLSPHTSDKSIVEAVLLYNKGVVHHSDGDNELAEEAYGLALGALMKIWSRSLIGSTAVFSCLSHIRTLLHNNLGAIQYLNGDERGSLYHFSTALQLSQQVRHLQDQQDWDITVATISSNLARTQWMTGDMGNDSLQQLFQEVLRLRSLWLPSDHPDVLCSHLNLGFIHYVRHDTDGARHHLQEYLKVASQDNSTLDPVPAMAHLLLIENEDKEDRLSVELVRTVRAMLDTREDYGEINVEVASLLNYIGTVLFHRRELEHAILFYKQELRLEKLLSENAEGVSVSVTYNNIGRILQELGKLEEAIVCYYQALRTETNASDICPSSEMDNVLPAHALIVSEDMPQSTLNLYSTIWYNLGLIYDRMGTRNEAVVAFKMSLKLRQTLFGEDHQDVACLWYNIGTLQMECQHLDDASASLKEALRIKRLGSFHEDPDKILATLKKLAYLQEGRGRIEEALETHHEILQLHSSSTTSKNSDAMAATLLNMSELMYAQGNCKLSLDIAQRSLDALLKSDVLLTSVFPDHVKGVEAVAKTMLLVGSLHHEMLNADLALDTFLKARVFVELVVNHYGSSVTPQLSSLLGALQIVVNQSCAPAA